jgi:manganese/zinc/iron transport system permease protein
MNTSFLSFFTDPILRASTIGCICMCITTAVIGVLSFIRKRSLLGETLSHASYPGIIIGAIIFYVMKIDDFSFIGMMLGGGLSSFIALVVIDRLVKKYKTADDAALCFVLAAFFGVGILIVSHIQSKYIALYQQLQGYLYGQAATMRDCHVIIYAVFAVFVIVFIFMLFHKIEAIYFNKEFAKSVGIKTDVIETFIFLMMIMAIIIGMRSVGILLMSGMLLAPAIAARQFTSRLSVMFVLSAVFGGICGFFGNYFSVVMTNWVNNGAGGKGVISFPTGPMIVILAAILAVVSLLLAPEKGVVFRVVRIFKFRLVTKQENLLKAFYKKAQSKNIAINDIATIFPSSKVSLRLLLLYMQMQGWVGKIPSKKIFFLTKDGRNKALRIIRLHRLWEVYLDYIGVTGEKVHSNAEIMEHSITSELEGKLEVLLSHPRTDPHHQPIPEKEALLYDDNRIN